MKIIVHNLHNDKKKVYDLASLSDLEKVASDFGIKIDFLFGDKQPSFSYGAARRLAEYLSNHYFEAILVDDDENLKLYDPNDDEFAETINIPEQHVFDSATHRR